MLSRGSALSRNQAQCLLLLGMHLEILFGRNVTARGTRARSHQAGTQPRRQITQLDGDRALNDNRHHSL